MSAAGLLKGSARVNFLIISSTVFWVGVRHLVSLYPGVLSRFNLLEV